MTTPARCIATGLAVFALLAACGTQPDPDSHATDAAPQDDDPHEDRSDGSEDGAEPLWSPEDPDDDLAPDVMGRAPDVQVSTPGFDGETITLGVLQADPDSPDASRSTGAITGIEAYLGELDAQGGVAGKHPVQVVEIDLSGNADAMFRTYRSAQDDLLLVAHVPSTATEPLLEAFENDEVVGASAALDARWLREQNTLAFATPNEMQVAHGIDWFRGKVRHTPGKSPGPGGQPTALLPEAPGPHQPIVCGLLGADDAEAEETGSVKALRAIAAERRMRLPVVVGVPEDDAGNEVTVDSLIENDCEAVVVDAPTTSVVPMLRAAEALGFHPQWILLSSSWSPDIAAALPTEMDQEQIIVVGNGLTDWGPDAESSDIVTELRAARDRHSPDTVDGDLDFAFGYAQAAVVHQVLERAVTRGDLSRGGIINAINSITEIDLGGLADDVVYGRPDKRRTPRRSAIFTVDAAAPWGLRLIDGPRASASSSTVARELSLR